MKSPCEVHSENNNDKFKKHASMTERTEQTSDTKEKQKSEEIANFKTQRRICTEILSAERNRYVQQAKDKITELPRDSTRWWRLNQQLLCRKANISSVMGYG